MGAGRQFRNLLVIILLVATALVRWDMAQHGEVASDFGGELYGGVAAQGEFLRGAAQSTGGKPILCLSATTDDGRTSRIRARLLTGEAVTVARADVHYVITEYGIAYLFGKSVRERAIALIELAHPKFRAGLLEEAIALGDLEPGQTLQSMRAYPVEDERRTTLKGGQAVMLRPAASPQRLARHHAGWGVVMWLCGLAVLVLPKLKTCRLDSSNGIQR